MSVYGQADFDAEDNSKATALHKASARGWADVAGCLLKARAEPGHLDTHEETPLFGAARGGHVALVALLATALAERKPREAPVQQKKVKMFRANTNNIKSTPTDNCNINSTNEFGQTVLAVAAKAGQAEVTRVLLEMSSDASIVDKQNLGPVHLAAQRGHLAVLQVLFNAGIKLVEPQPVTRKTPLMLAAQHGQLRGTA